MVRRDDAIYWAASLNRRAEVETELFDMAAGKRPLPTAEDCRRMAIKLGVDPDFRARTERMRGDK